MTHPTDLTIASPELTTVEIITILDKLQHAVRGQKSLVRDADRLARQLLGSIQREQLLRQDLLLASSELRLAAALLEQYRPDRPGHVSGIRLAAENAKSAALDVNRHASNDYPAPAGSE